jgi:predicted Zn finger-like uncharacterized protein
VRFLDIGLKISDLDCDPLERSETAMILTCPKCATRFFADDHAIGPAGRRVQCAACREVWFSAGAHPAPFAVAADVLAEEAPPSSEAPLFVARGAPARNGGGYGRSFLTGLLILAVVIVAGMVVFKRQLEQMFPGATAVYQSVGLSSSGRAGG